MKIIKNNQFYCLKCQSKLNNLYCEKCQCIYTPNELMENIILYKGQIVQTFKKDYKQPVHKFLDGSLINNFEE